jgi:hypothetical protein
MFPDLPQPVSPQPTLFQFDESFESIELFPEVWSALEDFTRSDVKLRAEGLERLIELDAPRRSPVVAYILTTKITEQNLKLRARIIEAIGSILSSSRNGSYTPSEIRSSLHLYLSSFRTRQIYAILQVSAQYETHERHVVELLNSCPYAGNHLLHILKDTKIPIDVRKQAAIMIGKVGYLNTIPALERYAGRIESRLYGQKAMYFAPQGSTTESNLLPYVIEALSQLHA